ncbi:hypothetical protein AAVH_31609, partial [Aphelenchoides avenae]
MLIAERKYRVTPETARALPGWPWPGITRSKVFDGAALNPRVDIKDLSPKFNAMSHREADVIVPLHPNPNYRCKSCGYVYFRKTFETHHCGVGYKPERKEILSTSSTNIHTAKFGDASSSRQMILKSDNQKCASCNGRMGPRTAGEKEKIEKKEVAYVMKCMDCSRFKRIVYSDCLAVFDVLVKSDGGGIGGNGWQYPLRENDYGPWKSESFLDDVTRTIRQLHGDAGQPQRLPTAP